MAAKRKRRRAKRKSNPKKKRTTHRRRRKAANPSIRRRRSHRRRARSNPRRRARRAHALARSSRRNPSRRRTHRRRRNPGGPLVDALIGLGVGAAAFVATDVITFYATGDMAKDGQRNRKILAVIGAGAGLYLAQKKPLIGLGLAVGALLAGFGNAIDLLVLRMLPAKPSGGPLAPAATAGLGAVAYDNMQALQYEGGARMLGMGAVEYDNMRGMGAVAYDNMQGWETMGDPVPAAPWDQANPFGQAGQDGI